MITRVNFTLDIDTSDDDLMTNPRKKLQKLIREVADKVGNGSDGGKIKDVNGNNIGDFELDIEEEDEDEEDEDEDDNNDNDEE